jgi:nucleoside-diphosphate-sugar epimerase
MKLLFIGGTGLISSACTTLALSRGHELFHLNRGNRSAEPGVTTLRVADVHDEAAVAAALGGRRFDAVVDFIAFKAEDIERDVRLFGGRTGHYLFLSSATVMQNPVRTLPIREDSPLWAPDWQYARDKIACEEAAMAAFREGFPVTIVRPSHTYGERSVPLAMRSLTKPYTTIARLRAGKPMIVPGDGTSMWTLTHTSDFAVGLVGLLGRRGTIGQSYNIVSDEPLTWDQVYRETAAALGVEEKLVHMTSEFIVDCMPDLHGRLLGDGSLSSIFDNSKIKRAVPDYRPSVSYAEGIRRSIAWLDADPARQEIDSEIDAQWDRMIDAWERGMDVARKAYLG